MREHRVEIPWMLSSGSLLSWCGHLAGADDQKVPFWSLCNLKAVGLRTQLEHLKPTHVHQTYKILLNKGSRLPSKHEILCIYQLRPDSLLYLSHNSCQMVFLFVRFVSANRLRRTDVALVKKKLVTLSGCKLSVAGLHIIKKKKKKNPSPLIPIPHLDWICGLKIEGHSLIRISETQTFQSNWKGNLYVSNRALCLLWNVN